MKNGKVFGKINLIDFLVVLGLILACVGFGIRISVSRASEWSRRATVEYVVKVDGIRDFTVQGLEKSKGVFDEDAVYIGEVSGVETENAKTDLVMFNGKRKFIERPERYASYVTVRADGVLEDGTFVNAADENIYVGSYVSLYTNQVVTSGQVVSLTQIEK